MSRKTGALCSILNTRKKQNGMAQLVYASSERFITPIKSFYRNNMCLSGVFYHQNN